MRDRPVLPIVVATFLLLMGGCSKKTEAPLPAGGRLINVPIQDLSGLSGLARDDTGALFAVPEEDRMLVEIAMTGEEKHRYRVNGVPNGVEFESLAWLSKDKFAMGTEGGCSDGAEHVLVVEREGEGAKVTKDIKVPLATWGAKCDEKRGIEGLCSAGGKMLAGIENPLDGKNGERWAVLARIDEATGEIAPFRLALTSKTGKISALECRVKNDAMEVFAIERHFEVAKLLTFTIPLTGAGEEAPRTPRVVMDLFPFVGEAKRNFEGVVWLDDQHVMLIIDNKYGKVTGPNQMVEVELPK